MKEADFLELNYWSPFKKGIYVSLTFNFTNNDYPDRYIYFAFLFFSLTIDFTKINLCKDNQ